MRAAETPIVGTGRIAAGGRGVRLSVKEGKADTAVDGVVGGLPEIARGCGAARPSRWCVCGSAHDSQRRVSDACRLAHITPCGYESLEIAPKSCSRRSRTATPVDRTMAASLGSRSLRSQSLMAALRARELSRIPRASRCSGTVGAGLRVPPCRSCGKSQSSHTRPQTFSASASRLQRRPTPVAESAFSLPGARGFASPGPPPSVCAPCLNEKHNPTRKPSSR